MRLLAHLTTRRRTVGSLMLLVGVSSVLLAVGRPLAKPPTVRAALAVLGKQAPRVDPGFDPRDFRVASTTKTPSGYWAVHFVRVAGRGVAEHVVCVPPGAVRKHRFNPWLAY